MSLKSELFSYVTMISCAVKFMVSLIVNLTRPEIDQVKVDQLAAGWLAD